MASSQEAFRTWFESFCGDKNGKITISKVDGPLTKVAGCYRKVSETLYERPDSSAALYYRDGAFCLNSEGHMSPHAPEFKIKMKMSEVNCTEYKKLVSEDGNTTCEMNIFEPKTFASWTMSPNTRSGFKNKPNLYQMKTGACRCGR